MAVKSVYHPGFPPGATELHLAGEEHQHLKVSRAARGECVEIFDGAGRVWTGEVVSPEKTVTHIRILDERSVPPPEVEIVLGQAVIRNAAFEWILEKAVEVGVTGIVPFRAARSNETGQGRERRWRRVIVEAAKQSKRYHLPRLDPVDDLAGLLGRPAASKILFAERSGGRLESALSGAPALYAIGPEGGWTDAELETARALGVPEVRLGNHILRSETAAIVAAGLIAYELGAL